MDHGRESHKNTVKLALSAFGNDMDNAIILGLTSTHAHEWLAGIVVFAPKILAAHKIADDCQIIQLCIKELQTLCQRLVVLNFSARICAG